MINQLLRIVRDSEDVMEDIRIRKNKYLNNDKGRASGVGEELEGTFDEY